MNAKKTKGGKKGPKGARFTKQEVSLELSADELSEKVVSSKSPQDENSKPCSENVDELAALLTGQESKKRSYDSIESTKVERLESLKRRKLNANTDGNSTIADSPGTDDKAKSSV